MPSLASLIQVSAATLAAIAAVGTSAAPFQNGGFESGTLNNTASFDTLAAGSTAITGWTVVGDGVDYIGALWPASQGSRSIDMLSCGVSGGVAQTFDTTAGATYLVTFSLAGNPDGGVKTLTVSAASNTQSYTFNTAGFNTSNVGWRSQTFTFTATASSTTLTFLGGIQGGGSSCAGSALDNVAVAPANGPVSAVPVGGGLAALLLAGAGLAALARRRTHAPADLG